MSEKNSRSIEEEVRKLFKENSGKISNNDFIKLRNKYNDIDIVEKIQQIYLEKYERINKKAKKFAHLIREKYGNNQYPFHTLLEKAKLYKQKYHLSEEEFTAFHRIYEQELIEKKSSEVIIPFNNMSKLLGNVNVEVHSQININDTDLKYFQEIIKLHSSSKTLHAQVQLQSFQYQDCADEVLESKFHREMGVSPSDHIHPVLAALFVPKFKELDKYLLEANIAAIVKVRFSSASFITRSDYELFYALTHDPNDVICDGSSPMLDLLNRVQLQIALWNNILNLRGGNFFNTSFRQFIHSVDMCKRTSYDNPELLYGRSENVILKRLLSTFSFRPIYVATIPSFPGDTGNPYNQQIRPLITSIPMYNFKLPFESISETNSNSYDLKSVFTQTQVYIEHNKFVSKETRMINARNILIITVDRTSYNMASQLTPALQPYNISILPTSVGGKYKMNTKPIQFNESIDFDNMTLRLRSVIITNYHDKLNIVLGSSSIIIRNATTNTEYYYYDPNKINVKQSNSKLLDSPMRRISESSPDHSVENFRDLASELGTAFIYEVIDSTTN